MTTTYENPKTNMEHEVIEKPKKKRKPSNPSMRMEKARKRLLKQIYTLDTKHLIAKVGFILNQMPKTRDNDKLLTVEIYKTFFEEYLIDGDKIRLDDLLTLPKSYEMQRYRAHIQNVLGLFKASLDVQKKRKVRRKEWRDETSSILSPPIEVLTGNGSLDSPHLVMGSLWIYDRLKSHSILKEFKSFRSKSIKNQRLRFSKITQNNMETAIKFFSIMLKFSDALGFKAHIFDNYREKVDSYHEAFLQHILEMTDLGIETSTIELPKSISIIKNKEMADSGENLDDIHRNMNRILADKYENQIFIDQLFSIETESSPLLQINDFFTGSLHFLYDNQAAKKDKAKEAFAKEILKQLEINYITCIPRKRDNNVSIIIV